MFEKKDLILIFLIIISFFFVLFFLPTKKIELYIGKSQAIINDKNKCIIIRSNYKGNSKIKYRIYPFFVKLYIKPVYYGNRINIYKDEKTILIKNNKNYNLSKLGAYNILTIDYLFFKKQYNFYILDGNLPVINIDLAKNNAEINSDTKIPMMIKIISDTNAFVLNNKEGLIKKRGEHASKYNIWLSKPAKIFSLPKRKEWSLVGNTNDLTCIRDKISFDLFGLIDSSKIYPKTVFVELFIDGIYKGLYALEEKYDCDLFGYKKYNKQQIKPAVIFRSDVGLIFNTISYKLIENIKNGSKYYYDKYEYIFKQIEPNIKKKNCLNEIWDFLFYILNSSDSDFFDKTDGIYSKINIDDFIDVFLFLQLVKNLDGTSNNLFFSKKEIYDINEKSLFTISSWDHDWSLGNTVVKKFNHIGLIGVDSGGKNILFQRLYYNPEIRQRIKNRWFELRKKKWSNNSILNLIDCYNNTIKCTYNRIDNQYLYEKSKKRSYVLQEDIDYRVEWFKLRLSWLDDYFNKI